MNYGQAGYPGGKKMDINELILELEIFNDGAQPEHDHYCKWLATVKKIKQERTAMLKLLKDYAEIWEQGTHPQGKCVRSDSCLICRAKAIFQKAEGKSGCPRYDDVAQCQQPNCINCEYL